MFSRKIAAFFVVLVLLLTSAVNAQDTVTVTFWSPFTGPDGVVIEQMVAEFNETVGAEEGVTVELLINPWEEYYTKLTVAMATETGPNLAIAHAERVPGFAAEDALIPFATEVMDALGIIEVK